MQSPMTPIQFANKMAKGACVITDETKTAVARYALAYTSLADVGTPGFTRLGKTGADDLYASLGGMHTALDHELQCMVAQFGFGFPGTVRDTPRITDAMKAIVAATK